MSSCAENVIFGLLLHFHTLGSLREGEATSPPPPPPHTPSPTPPCVFFLSFSFFLFFSFSFSFSSFSPLGLSPCRSGHQTGRRPLPVASVLCGSAAVSPSPSFAKDRQSCRTCACSVVASVRPPALPQQVMVPAVLQDLRLQCCCLCPATSPSSASDGSGSPAGPALAVLLPLSGHQPFLSK